jgi:transketolase
MFEISNLTARTYSMLGQRGAIFGVASLECAKSNPLFMLMTADLATLSGMERYKKIYPNQHLNIGIAEQNMLGVAAGLTAEGFHVVVTTYATFVTMRSCEQIRHYLGYMNLPIVVVGSGAGLSQGFAGNTHYTIEDISMMRAIPNLRILSPSDAVSAVKLFNLAIEVNVPTYIRLTGNLNCPIVYRENTEFSLGGSNKVVEGTEITILACGTMVSTAIKAAKELKVRGFSASVVDMYSIKPIDADAIIAAKESKLIVTVEEHNKMGGLGAAVAEILSNYSNMPRLLRLGISDRFDLAGEYEYLLQQNRLTPILVVEDIIEVLNQGNV